MSPGSSSTSIPSCACWCCPSTSKTQHSVSLVTLGGFGYLLKDRSCRSMNSWRPPSVATGGSASTRTSLQVWSPPRPKRSGFDADRPRAHRARPHGSRPDQYRYRQAPSAERAHGRGPHPPPPAQARHPGHRRRAPSGCLPCWFTSALARTGRPTREPRPVTTPCSVKRSILEGHVGPPLLSGVDVRQTAGQVPTMGGR